MFFTKLRYFQTVCQHGSYTKAASILAVSQPAISIAIKNLEDELGVKLFIRDGKAIHMTDEGQIFFNLTNELLLHAEAVMETMRDISTQQKRIRLGLTPMLAMAILPNLYREFHNAHPDIILNVTEAPRQILERRLARNQLDVIIVNTNAALAKDPLLQKRAIADFQYCFCVSKDHRFANHKHITVSEIGDTPIICFGIEYDQPAFLKQVFFPYGVTPNLMYHANSVSTIVEMIQSNHFGGFLYRELSNKWPDLKFIPMYPAIQATPCFFWKKDSINGSHIRELIKCVDMVEIAKSKVKKPEI